MKGFTICITVILLFVSAAHCIAQKEDGDDKVKKVSVPKMKSGKQKRHFGNDEQVSTLKYNKSKDARKIARKQRRDRRKYARMRNDLQNTGTTHKMRRDDKIADRDNRRGKKLAIKRYQGKQKEKKYAFYNPLRRKKTFAENGNLRSDLQDAKTIKRMRQNERLANQIYHHRNKGGMTPNQGSGNKAGGISFINPFEGKQTYQKGGTMRSDLMDRESRRRVRQSEKIAGKTYRQNKKNGIIHPDRGMGSETHREFLNPFHRGNSYQKGGEMHTEYQDKATRKRIKQNEKLAGKTYRQNKKNGVIHPDRGMGSEIHREFWNPFHRGNSYQKGGEMHTEYQDKATRKRIKQNEKLAGKTYRQNKKNGVIHPDRGMGSETHYEFWSPFKRNEGYQRGGVMHAEMQDKATIKRMKQNEREANKIYRKNKKAIGKGNPSTQSSGFNLFSIFKKKKRYDQGGGGHKEYKNKNR